MKQQIAKTRKIPAFILLLSTAKWILGKRHSKILIFASIIQIIVALLDVLFLALIGPFVFFISAKNTLDDKFSILSFTNLSGNKILFLIVLVIFVKNIAGLLIQGLVLNSFATREAEVGTALVQASLFSESNNEQSLHSSSLLQTITYTISNLFIVLFRPIIGFISELATVFAVIIALLFINTEVAIISVFYFSFFGFFMIRFTSKKQQIFSENILDSGRDSLRSFTEIKLMSRELRLANKDHGALQKLNQFRVKTAKLSAASTLLIISSRYLFEIIFLFGISLVVIYSQFFQENQDILPLVALLVAAGYRILPSLHSISINVGNFRYSKALLESLNAMGNRFNIRSTDLTFTKIRKLQDRKQFSGDLHLENIFYRYPISKKTIFSNFNLIVSSRTTLYVQGLSGAGKTTLISLITGSLSPQQGRIYFFDRKQEVPMDGTVNGINYLSQEVTLLDESFAYNIAMVELLENDFPRLKEAAAKAGILERIMQSPNGFNTQVGENGALLSAGERQRLGIARSLFAQPALLILDEPTANLDAAAEKLIWDTLGNLKGQLTILIVSHRVVPESVYDSVLKLTRSR